MKCISTYQKMGILAMLFVISTLSSPLCGQINSPLQWEGYFMNDFRTVVSLLLPADQNASGTIRMYAGEQLIQDDELSEVEWTSGSLEFTIAAKETRFQGSLHENGTLLEGYFTFPDGSEHPFKANKKSAIEITSDTKENPAVAPAEDTPAAPKENPAVAPAEDTPAAPKENTATAPVENASAAPELTPEVMLEDLDMLFDALIANHPALYACIPEDSFRKAFEQTAGACKKPLSKGQFLYAISSLLEKTGCSHTCARLGFEEWQQTKQSAEFVPFGVATDGEHLYYSGSAEYALTSHSPGTEIISANTIPSGSSGAEIIAINGIPSHEIITRLYDIIPAETRRHSTKLNQLNRYFSYWYHLLDPSKEFRVEYMLEGSSETALVPASLLGEARDPFAFPGNAGPLKFTMDKENTTGILKVSTFHIPDMDRYLQTLDSVFAFLRENETASLMLDLRDNAGGHPIFAAQLFSYLTSHPFTYFERIPEIPDFDPLYGIMQPNENAFTEKLFVLVNGGSLSTTGHLISLLDYHTQAVFVGQQPGSTNTCNDFSTQVRLKGSGIEVSIPRITFRTAVPDKKDIPNRFVEIPVAVLNEVLSADESLMEVLQPSILPEILHPPVPTSQRSGSTVSWRFSP